MLIMQIVSKLLLILIATNGFVVGIKKDRLIEDKDMRRVGMLAGVTVYLGSIILFYFAGVFEIQWDN